MVDIPRANLLLRELAPGFATLGNRSDAPVVVSASTALADHMVQANALADDVFTLEAAGPIEKNSLVQLSLLGRVETYVEGGTAIGRAVTSAQAIGDTLLVSVQWGALAGGGGATNPEDVFLIPGTTAPEGNVIGVARGQVYTQLAPSGTYKQRDWTFNGTPGTNVGWI